MIERAYARFHDALMRQRRAVAVAVAALLALAAAAASGVRIDTSFRPFYADRSAATEQTEAFERRFGQASGAFLAAIVEHPDVLSPGFLLQLAALSERAYRLPHVAQVHSLTHTHWPDADGRPRSLWDPGADVSPESLAAIAETPGVRGTLLGLDGRSALLAVRVDLPLSDVEGRARVIHEFEALLARAAPVGSRVQLTGASVVEEAYAGIVLEEVMRGNTLLSTVLVIVLFAYFRSWRAVVVIFGGVLAALPLTLGFMRIIGLSVTMVSSHVLSLVLIVGVTNAIHLQEGYYRQREAGLGAADARRRAFAGLGLPALATSLTTLVGFMSLGTAGILAIREFALASSFGIACVYLTTLVLTPLLQAALCEGETGMRGQAGLTLGLLRTIDRLTASVPVATVAGFTLVIAALAFVGLPRLNVDQKVNEELDATHPVRTAQAALEEQYSGFLGPELWISSRDGVALTDPARVAALRDAAERLRGLRETLSVRGFTDFLGEAQDRASFEAQLARLEHDAGLRRDLAELVSADRREASLQVRTTDMGSRRAGDFTPQVLAIARDALGPAVEVKVVGPWWLAQVGLQRLMSDILASVTLATLTILPLLAFSLRRWRLVAASLLPNVVPVVAALAMMGALDIPFRVSTAMVLAIALGLVVDDTVYLLLGMQQELDAGRTPRAAASSVLLTTGRPCSFSSCVLIVGFATLAFSPLHALRDVGIVGSLTLACALAADLLMTPALFVLLHRRGRGRPLPAADEVAA